MTGTVADKDTGAQANRGQKRAVELTEQDKRSLKKMKVAQLLGIEQPEAKVDETKTALSVSGDWETAQAITRKMQDRGMPLTILTGFLGAGKSTILNYILKADHKLKIAVLINEFGEVDIDNQLVDTMTKGEDGEPVVLNNGCICCTVSQGFLTAVNQVLQRADDIGSYPDYILVETTGLADPKPIVDSISGTELRSDIYVDQVLTVVDASVWGEDHYGSETARKQIQSADTVLLSKIDLIKDENRLKDVIASIISIRPGARILRSQKGHVPIAALFDMELAEKPKKAPVKKDDHKHAEHKENGHSHDHKHKDGHEHKGKDSHEHKHDGDHKHDHDHKHDDKHDHDHKHDHKHGHDHKHSHDHKHGHDHVHGEDCDHSDHDHKNHLEAEGFGSMSFVTSAPLSLRRFRDCFMENLPDNVFRAKGLLYFDKYDMRFVFHWSGQRYNVEEEEWPMGTEKKNQLVIIGRNLDQKHITKMLEDCVVKPGEESDDEYMYAEDGEYGEEYAGEYGAEYGAGVEGDAGSADASTQVNDASHYGAGVQGVPQYGAETQSASQYGAGVKDPEQYGQGIQNTQPYGAGVQGAQVAQQYGAGP